MERDIAQLLMPLMAATDGKDGLDLCATPPCMLPGMDPGLFGSVRPLWGCHCRLCERQLKQSHGYNQADIYQRTANSALSQQLPNAHLPIKRVLL